MNEVLLFEKNVENETQIKKSDDNQENLESLIIKKLIEKIN